VPHISVVFCEIWDTAALEPSLSMTNQKLGYAPQWNPTSRKTRARCGAPVVSREQDDQLPLGHEPHSVGDRGVERFLDDLQIEKLLVHASPPRWIEPS
jgi:hypothetical protein